MYEFLALLGINRRKTPIPVPQERRRPSRKEANSKLNDSIERLQETVKKALNGHDHNI